MARFKIILLEKPDPGKLRFALWADVVGGRQPFYARPEATSAYRDADPALRKADDTAVANGSVAEKVGEISLQSLTNAQVRARLEALWSQWDTHVQNVNPWDRYGTTWNGTTWVPSGAE